MGTEDAARRRLALLAIAGAAAAFWGLRVAYWTATDETLFSDMADFHGIAQRFAAGGTLAMTDFWQSYRAPVLPFLGAIGIALFGNDLLVWRLLQTTLLFAGLLWLAYEIFRATRRWTLPITLLWLVALAKPSVFWSFKFAKEGLHEALLYVVLAATLRLLRRPSVAMAVGAGALTFVAALNRSNFVIALGLVPLLVLVTGAIDATTVRTRLRRTLPFALAFGLGAALAWAPWGLRTARLYGHPLLLTTDGGAVALDALSRIDVDMPNGSTRELSHTEHLVTAPARFANDALADAWLSGQMRRWILANPGRWSAHVLHCVHNSAFDRTISLTQVPRDHLLGPPWNVLLLDKRRVPTQLGMLGLLLAAALDRRLLALALLTILPWLVACCFLDLPRLFEPIIPMVLFGNVLFVTVVIEWSRRGWQHWRRSRSNGADGAVG